MKRVDLFLVPSPGAKPEFLATIESSTDDNPLTRIPTPQLILEGYTRDSWAWKPASCWKTLILRSVDGRNKVPGFVKYLKERQKCAYFRIGKKEHPVSGLLVVTYIQPKQENPDMFQCRITWDVNQIPNCPLAKVSAAESGTTAALSKPSPTPAPKAQPQSTTSKPGGMLGSLLAGQARTNEQYSKAVPLRKAVGEASMASNGGTATASADGKSSQDVLNDWRAELEQKFLDFDISNENVLKIPISLAEQTKWILSEEEKAKVTMEVLKYICYEQAEEVNEEWVAHKEPSEFMDEIVMAVYKEAPPEVLEDVQRADLPDEVRGQQRALQAEQQKRIAMTEAKRDAERERSAALSLNQDEEEMAVLNVNKRDRRTIEEIERELKRQKS